jgi:hypothetical protein
VKKKFKYRKKELDRKIPRNTGFVFVFIKKMGLIEKL